MAKKIDTKDQEVLVNNQAEVAKALEILFASGYVSRKKLYWENFIRGIFFSVGGIIGATIAIAILLWFLSLFDQIPLVGPFFEHTRETIEKGSTTIR